MHLNVMKIKSIVKQVEHHAQTDPLHTAVVCGNAILTYQQLNDYANQFAAYLKTYSLKPFAPVALYYERNIELIIIILALLKLGHPYVPLPIESSGHYIRDILLHADIQYLICMRPIESFTDKTVNIFYDVNKLTNFVAATNPELEISDDMLAYILFTTGSTGKPKGVKVSYGNLASICHAWNKAYKLDQCELNHLQLANYTFDVFTGDLVRALCFGHRLVICPKEIFLIPEKLFDFMKSHHINFAEFTPVVLRRLYQYLSDQKLDLSFMDTLICGSDSWTVNEYKQFKQLCGPNTRLINSYGLTEATIDSSYFEVEDIMQYPLAEEDLVPIGKAFANTQLFLVDHSLQLVAKGKLGEIIICGDGVAKGYINQSNSESDKFFQFNYQGESLPAFRTGDLGWQFFDGTIAFLGRKDSQIKLHGVRIEPTAIEEVVNQFPGVIASMVTTNDETGNLELNAYLVLNQNHTIDIDTLINFLQQRLNTHLIPSAFYQIDFLPINRNGKLERNKPLDAKRLTTQIPYIAPRNATEQMLMRVICQTLSVDKISIDSNILSGHRLDSIKIAHLIAKIEQISGKRLCINQFLCSLTIAELATEMLKSTHSNLSAGQK